MIKVGMLVRCPVDEENMRFPRSFAMGKIESIDEISEKAKVIFMDTNGVSVYHEKPKDIEIEMSRLVHCKVKKGALATYKRRKVVVCAGDLNKNDEFRYYYVKDEDGSISYVCESELMVSYNDFIIGPLLQLKTYEFQNPRWFTGRCVVSKTMNYIENSLYGFKELAGCKIFLKPHQLKTVMRCLQAPKCRYMLADEVGLGKTVEALSILKIYVKDNKNKKILIAVPDALVEQWKNELAFKFKLFEGENINSNIIDLVPMSNIESCLFNSYDFVIFDEVHRCLKDRISYQRVLQISKQCDNILMLSATPLQKRDEEFLRLLCLIQPEKYEKMGKERFQVLLEQQNKIIRKIFNALDELGALNEALVDSNNEKNEETEEIFEAVFEELSDVSKLIQDDRFNTLLKNINYDAEDCGISEFQNIIAYVCENFQLEKSIIRNRRQKVNSSEDTKGVERKLIDLSYEADCDDNIDEWNAYTAFAEWLENVYGGELDYYTDIIPVVHSLFSSAQAFNAQLAKLEEKTNIPYELKSVANRYAMYERNLLDELNALKQGTKLCNILDFIKSSVDEGKVILFTDFKETFDLYKEILIKVFGVDKCCFFSKEMNTDDLELNAYRFQTEEHRRILLSDASGGEGRNFQHVDYLIHIDIPWNANDIEQRIGRLDRIGRDSSKDVVSVVAYGKETVEENLFELWNNGLNLFTKAQSGLEIIMGDIEDALINCLKQSFKFGLVQANNELADLIKQQLDTLKKEQVYDIAAYQFKAINKMLDETVEKYTKNETNLFGEAMMSWAGLAGFHGKEDGENVVAFSKNSIVWQSLVNTLFMPPDMKAIIENKLNQLRNRVRILNNERIIHGDNSYIRGTFNRNKALQNDYLNFFAPGDDIFDSITENALGSYKGTCCCFSCKSNINWKGFVFTWKLEVDDKIIYANKLSEHLINQYKGYLPSEQIITVFDDSDSEIEDSKVVSEFVSIVQNPKGASIKHLGKRDGANPPIANFIKAYPPKAKWYPLVDMAHKQARGKAIEKSETKKKTLLNALYNELVSTLSAQKASAIFFDKNEDIETQKKQNEIIYKMIANASITLDSVCYVVMRNEQ